MSDLKSVGNSSFCNHASHCFPRIPTMHIPKSIRIFTGNNFKNRPRLFKIPRLFGMKVHSRHVPNTTDNDLIYKKERQIASDESMEPISVDLKNSGSITPLDNVEDEVQSPIILSPVVLTFKNYYKEDSSCSDTAYFMKPAHYNEKSISTTATSSLSQVSSFSRDTAAFTYQVPSNTPSFSSNVDESTKLRDSLRVRHFMRIASIHGHRILA